MPTIDSAGNSPLSESEEVSRARLRLRHLSLPELDAKGVVDWDRENGVVRKGRRFDDVWDESW